MLRTEEMSYGLPRPRASFKASSMGRAKASPTMVTPVQRWRSTSLQMRCGSSPSLELVTTVPPVSSGTIEPSHMPVPCMSGQAAKFTLKAFWAALARMIAGMSAALSGTLKPSAATLPIITEMKSWWEYITPFGMPVVPPV